MTVQHRVPPVFGGAPSSATTVSPRQRWLLLAAAAWLVTGLQLDAWAHGNIPELESFWTPWHAVLYSGIAACGSVLAWLTLGHLRRTGLDVRDLRLRHLLDMPLALRLPVVGMGLLLVGGGVDTLWHNLFGIERDLEIFVSPSHIVIISGMVLVAAGPALLRSAEPGADIDGRRLSGADAALVLLSVLLTLVPLHTFSLHASALAYPRLGTGADVMSLDGTEASDVHGYVVSTVLLLAPLVVLGRRWRLPRGTGLVLVAVPAALMWLAFAAPFFPWYPVVIAAAAGLVEIGARTLQPAVRSLGADLRWVLLGAAAPLVLWGTVLLSGAVLAANGSTYYGWNVHVTTGLLALTGVTGAATALVVRRLRA